MYFQTASGCSLNVSAQATFDTNKWSREAGSPGASTFGKDGLIMTLNKDEVSSLYTLFVSILTGLAR